MLTRRSISFFFRSPGPLPIIGGDVVFSRPSPATFVDGQGTIRTIGPNTPRYEWTWVDGILRPLLLVEPASTNLVTESYALENWSRSPTSPIFQIDQPSPARDLKARWVSTAGSNGAHVAIVVNGLRNGTNAIGINLKFYEGGADRHMHFGLYDNTLGWRKLYRVTRNGDEEPIVTQDDGNGTVNDAQRPVRLTNGYWRITSRVPGVVADNTTLFYIYPGGLSGTGGGWFSGVQAEALGHATSEIETRGAIASREADLFHFGPPLPVPNPDGLVVYTRWLSNIYTDDETGGRVWEIGAPSTAPLWIHYQLPGLLANYYHNTAVSAQADVPFSSVPGDDCESLCVLAPPGEPHLYARINEGTTQYDLSGATAAFNFGYSGQRMMIGQTDGAAPYALRLVELAFIRLQDMGATPGVATPDAVMREVTDLLSRTTQIL